MPQRLRGENATFDIKIGRKTIVEEGRRITAKHVKDLEKSGAEKLEVPKDFLVGKILAHDIVDEETGEVLAAANDELTDELIDSLIEQGAEQLRTFM